MQNDLLDRFLRSAAAALVSPAQASVGKAVEVANPVQFAARRITKRTQNDSIKACGQCLSFNFTTDNAHNVLPVGAVSSHGHRQTIIDTVLSGDGRCHADPTGIRSASHPDSIR
jgi:hypothetical protein